MSKFLLAKERNISDFLETNELCECGRTHSLSSSQLYCYSGAIEKIDGLVKSFCPVGKLLVIADENVQYISDETEKSLTDTVYDEVILYRGFSVDKKNLAFFDTVTDDVRCILSIGGGVVTDVGKLLAHKKGIPLLSFVTALTATDTFCSSVEVWDGFVLKSERAKSPDVVIVDLDVIADTEGKLKASGFGVAMSEYLTVFDIFVRQKYLGEGLCKNLLDMLVNALDNVFGSGTLKGRQNRKNLEFYAENFLKISIAKELIGGSLRSGAENVLASLYLINGKKNDRLYGKTLFEIFVKTVKAYKLFFSSKTGDELPPDMDYRCDLLKSRLHIPDEAAYRITDCIISPSAFDEVKRITREERPFFLDGISEIDDRLDRMIDCFVSLYGEDDESIPKEDLYDAIVTSTEINGKFTAYSAMKYCGLLEKND